MCVCVGKDCDINCLFLSLSVPRLVILTLYYNIKTLRTLSVNAKQRYFYHRQRHRFIILNRQGWLNTILDTNTVTRNSSHHFKQHKVVYLICKGRQGLI